MGRTAKNISIVKSLNLFCGKKSTRQLVIAPLGLIVTGQMQIWTLDRKVLFPTLCVLTNMVLKCGNQYRCGKKYIIITILIYVMI